MTTPQAHPLNKYLSENKDYDIRKGIPSDCFFVPEEQKDKLIFPRKILYIRAMQGFRKNKTTGKWFAWHYGYIIHKSDMGYL